MKKQAMAMLQAHYAQVSDEALAEAYAGGESAYGPAVWDVIVAESDARSDGRSPAGHGSGEPSLDRRATTAAAPARAGARGTSAGPSLATAFWGCGVGGMALWQAVLGRLTGPRSLAIVALPAFALDLCYWVFLCALIWRSADRYRGRHVWEALARGSVALGLAVSVVRVLVWLFAR